MRITVTGTLLFWLFPLIVSGQFESSDLPVVIINTQGGQAIPDEPKITADLKIIYNGPGMRNRLTDPGNIYEGNAGIEIRGRYSASLPQKPYGLETRNDAGENLNIQLLSLPPENDWVLTANYNDKTFLRNFLAFHLFEKMGHYAPRSEYCEVIINGDYRGIYLLGEKIKIDRNRVDIAKLAPDDNIGDEITGGYIFSTDYYEDFNSWKSNYSPVNRPGASVYFVFVDPEPAELTMAQKSYLTGFVDSFEDVLYGSGFSDAATGYRAWLDIRSFVDYFILGELTRNVDAYKKSRFLYKNRQSRGGAIHSGPPWDYDWAWKDITEDCIHFNQTDGSGWAYRVADCDDWPVPPSWEVRLMEDDFFANRIYDRYSDLRETILSEAYLHHIIDSVAFLLNEARVRHYRKWDILGINVGTPEYGEQPATYEGEIEKFKAWIHRRLNWLDENMVGEPTAIKEIEQIRMRVFPNPVSDILHIEAGNAIERFDITDLAGRKVSGQAGLNANTVSPGLSGLGPGLYILRVYTSDGRVGTIRLIKR